jgi:hypothetical protein
MTMKHPTPEELVSWIYGEGPKQLNAHVKECAECRAQVETWRGTMKALDELPAPVTRRPLAPAPVRWAAAAALFLLLGIIMGRLAFSTSEANLRATMQKEMQQQRETLSKLMAANAGKLENDFESALQQARAEDRATYLLALKELNARHEAEIAVLKKGLETVVALADYGFEATEQRFAQIAAANGKSQQE